MGQYEHKLKNRNGREYDILAQIGNTYMLLDRNKAIGQIIIANGYDEKAQEWDYGNYYELTPENIVKASTNFLKVADDEAYMNLQRNLIKNETEYKILFQSLIEMEDVRFEKISPFEKDEIFEQWIDDSSCTNLMDMTWVYNACRELGIDLDAPKGQTRIFVDMDGTLAEFHHCENIEDLYSSGYFLELPEQPTVIKGIEEFAANNPGAEIYVLSSYLADSETALFEKEVWLDEHFPIKHSNRIFVPYGDEKNTYVPGGVRDSDILLDDYTANLKQWEKDGGIGIKLMNGINGTKGTWQGARVDINMSPKVFAQSISQAQNEHSRAHKRDIGVYIL